MPRTIAIVACLAALLVSLNAHAHSRSESYSNWTRNENALRGEVTVTTGEVMSLVALGSTAKPDTLLAEHLRNTVTAYAGADECGAPRATPLRAARGFLRVELNFTCDGTATALRYRALFAALPEHVHFARVFASGNLIAENVITDRTGSWSFADEGSQRHSVAEFLQLGVEHILSGIDHIAFLLGLLLVAGTVGRSVAAVTGFTLGHSVSLAAAVLGYVQADSRLVEAFIGFTVALVAVEFFQRHAPNRRLLARSTLLFAWVAIVAAVSVQRLPLTALPVYLGFGLFAYCYLMTPRDAASTAVFADWPSLLVASTCFGLVHGFGFAGFLMDTGLRGESLLAPLFGFNVGVELGQLALLAVFLVCGRLLGRQGLTRVAPIVATALCAVGVYWFVGRSFGI